jgi:8-oxo-dGTP pyrophosphatase MutT (NUDIX family)
VKSSNYIHVLARAAIIVDQHLLLARAIGAANTFLPGGHVEIGEPTTEALIRELSEELGLSSRIGRYLGAVEHQWSEGEVQQHEINHVFATSLHDVRCCERIASREPHLEFFWAPVAELSQHNLQPFPLVEFLPLHASGSHGPFWASTIAPSTALS